MVSKKTFYFCVWLLGFGFLSAKNITNLPSCFLDLFVADVDSLVVVKENFLIRHSVCELGVDEGDEKMFRMKFRDITFDSRVSNINKGNRLIYFSSGDEFVYCECQEGSKITATYSEEGDMDTLECKDGLFLNESFEFLYKDRIQF